MAIGNNDGISTKKRAILSLGAKKAANDSQKKDDVRASISNEAHSEKHYDRRSSDDAANEKSAELIYDGKKAITTDNELDGKRFNNSLRRPSKISLKSYGDNGFDAKFEAKGKENELSDALSNKRSDGNKNNNDNNKENSANNNENGTNNNSDNKYSNSDNKYFANEYQGNGINIEIVDEKTLMMSKKSSHLTKISSSYTGPKEVKDDESVNKNKNNEIYNKDNKSETRRESSGASERTGYQGKTNTRHSSHEYSYGQRRGHGERVGENNKNNVDSENRGENRGNNRSENRGENRQNWSGRGNYGNRDDRGDRRGDGRGGDGRGDNNAENRDINRRRSGTGGVTENTYDRVGGNNDRSNDRVNDRANRFGDRGNNNYGNSRSRGGFDQSSNNSRYGGGNANSRNGDGNATRNHLGNHSGNHSGYSRYNQRYSTPTSQHSTDKNTSNSDLSGIVSYNAARDGASIATKDVLRGHGSTLRNLSNYEPRSKNIDNDDAIIDQNDNRALSDTQSAPKEYKHGPSNVKSKKYQKDNNGDFYSGNRGKKKISGGDGGVHRIRSNVSIQGVNDIRAFEEETERLMYGRQKKIKGSTSAKQKNKLFREVELSEEISILDLATKLSEKANAVIRALTSLGIQARQTDLISPEVAEIVAAELGHSAKRIDRHKNIFDAVREHANRGISDVRRRPPVVAVMGHVDHGKTSLLDSLRATDVALHESGGITQKIGAYQVHLKNDKIITFLDTPGHSAFSAMRMRGAFATDIAIIVIASDDGIREQTVEAITHAKSANIPIIVAITKSDKGLNNLDSIKYSLFEHELAPDDMGGDIMVVPVSATKKTGLEEIEEAILIQSEFIDLDANYSSLASGMIIESKLDKSRGVLATTLIKDGSLKIGDIIVAGESIGKVRNIVNDKGASIKVAMPSMPVEIMGLDSVPNAGERFFTFSDESLAKEFLKYNKQLHDAALVKQISRPSIHDLLQNIGNDVKQLNLLVKSDAQGSIDAISELLKSLDRKNIKHNIIYKNVGAINSSDLDLASTAKAVIIGFNVKPESAAKSHPYFSETTVKSHNIIYNIFDDVKDMMIDMLDPVLTEKETGKLIVRKVFYIGKMAKIAGCYVSSGVIKRSSKIRVMRAGKLLYDGDISTLQRDKDNVREVKEGHECGLTTDGFASFEEGDSIVVYEIEKQKRTLDSE